MPTIELGGVAREVELTFMDCDGVIFDVNDVKVRAFVEALDAYPPEARQRMADYHQDHGGVSRYEKLRWFFREAHRVDDPTRAIEHALERFGQVSRQGYAVRDPRPEALAFAEQMGGPARVYVVSGSDQTELRDVFASAGLLPRFADVLGSPTPKRHHMREVLYARGVPASRALMVGDGRGDMQAARELGMPFVFLQEMSDWKDAKNALRDAPDCHWAQTWAELGRWLG
jgi:phosphoglycolate phosphatase-like HAD superfamily hydrolase